VSLFACMLMLYLMRELSGQLSEFAADIASGASLAGTTMSPRALTGNNIREKLENYQDNKKSQDLGKREERIKGLESGGGKGDSTAPKSSGSDSSPSGSNYAPKSSSSDSTASKSSGSESTAPKQSGGEV